MSLGILKCFVKNFHVGSLKNFGFKSAIMPEVIEDVTPEMLDDPLIKSAIRTGVVEFKPAKRGKKELVEKVFEDKIVSSQEQIVTEHVEPLQIINLLPPEGVQVTPEEVKEFKEQLEDAETLTLEMIEVTDDNQEEVFEALIEKLNAGQASDADIEILFNIINNMNGFDAQKAVKHINDNVLLLSMLAEKCKFAKVQTAAKKKLESIQQ